MLKTGPLLPTKSLTLDFPTTIVLTAMVGGEFEHVCKISLRPNLLGLIFDNSMSYKQLPLDEAKCSWGFRPRACRDHR